MAHRAPTEITLIFCTEFYYHANISTNGNTRSLEKFLYEILYHPEFVQFDLDRKIMRHLLDPKRSEHSINQHAAAASSYVLEHGSGCIRI